MNDRTAAAAPRPVVELLGIRHHGPGSARAVAARLRELRPDVVLIEGPPEAEAVLLAAADPALRPPVALLAYATDDPSRAAFWPFAVFSPEWQAIRYAVEAAVPVWFCDLPAAHQLAREPEERAGRSADPLAGLAAAGGYDDPERWWDDIVEHRLEGTSPFGVIAEAMRALRGSSTTDGSGAGGAEGPGRLFEARREAYMRTVLRKAMKAGFGTIAVVCGAWHVPALTGPLPPATADRALLRELPKHRVACTWVPWTHGRLASAGGYGAGVSSPGWYDHLFGTTGQVTAHWLTRVARVLREEDLPVSSAHVIEAVRLAEALAALRDRPLPGLAEVTEATRSVLCGGNDVLLDLVTRRLVVGERLGEVPTGVPQSPLVADLLAIARRLRLKRDALHRELDLDLRKETDAERSRLLHRLAVLGVPWGVPAPGARRGTGSFRESWSLCWRPEFEVDLVVAGRHGTTVLAAATGVVRGQAAEAKVLAEVTGAVESCLVAGLPGVLPEVLSAVDTLAAGGADVAQLMAALPPLARAGRYGDVRGTDTTAVRSVAGHLLARICAGLATAARGLDDEATAKLVELVHGVHEATGLLPDDARDRWLDAVSRLAGQDGLSPLLAGRLTRLLLDAERLAVPEVALRLGRALTPGVAPERAAGYVEGFFTGGAVLLIHDLRLLGLVDEWLSAIPPDRFTEVLPLLRRTFGAFAGPERRTIGERAAALRRGGGSVPAAPGGPTGGPEGEPYDTVRAEAALPVVAALLGVP
ncbi:hypothetical protein FNH05_12085 [Amycolatopsis rhizosphaerae]|uniref:Uncharacterized protein n=1 Tax=Amycolatopsis rhizosphaerae TaxID=2053003 RepID=A0A558CWT9_9PSEU|nr:DUF5682 family protein [Amycolatopsis rhizosphaerae]TVT53193.1 hypothetical protein FNH05_12085 [Amycolatopsis rhizosphaerae]